MYFLMEALNRFRQWLTWRRILHTVALIVLLLSLRDVVAAGLDISLILGLDWGLVLEVSAAMMILAARTHAMTVVQILRHRFSGMKKRLSRFIRRGRARRTHTSKPLFPPSSDDDGLGWHWLPAVS